MLSLGYLDPRELREEIIPENDLDLGPSRRILFRLDVLDLILDIRYVMGDSHSKIIARSSQRRVRNICASGNLGLMQNLVKPMRTSCNQLSLF